MTRSMTAFARQELQQPWGCLTWEIRSVNHRYLEPHLRLPDSLRAIEGPLREKLRLGLSRGKVECTLRFVPEAGGQSLRVDRERARELIAAAQSVRELMPDSAPLDSFQVLAWPGVLVESELDMEAVRGAALELFERALQDLIEGREREGQELRELIRQRLASIAEIVVEVRALMPQILGAQREMLRARIAELSQDVDPTRLEQELVLIAQRARRGRGDGSPGYPCAGGAPRAGSDGSSGAAAGLSDAGTQPGSQHPFIQIDRRRDHPASGGAQGAH